MNQKIKLQALIMAMNFHLANLSTDRYQELQEQMTENDRTLFDELGASIWEPFENESLSEVADRIANSADDFEQELLKAIETYKESVVSESVSNTIKVLADGAVADIFYDTKEFGDDTAVKQIDDTKAAMKVAVDQLYSMSVLLKNQSLPLPVAPWNSSIYGGHEEGADALNTMAIIDQRASSGQVFIDIEGANETHEQQLAVTVEIRDGNIPAAIVHFDNSQVAGVFTKTGDGELTLDLETNVSMEYESAGKYILRTAA